MALIGFCMILAALILHLRSHAIMRRCRMVPGEVVDVQSSKVFYYHHHPVVRYIDPSGEALQFQSAKGQQTSQSTSKWNVGDPVTVAIDGHDHDKPRLYDPALDRISHGTTAALGCVLVICGYLDF